MNKKVVITLLILLALLFVLVVWRSTSSSATSEFKDTVSDVSVSDLNHSQNIEVPKKREDIIQEELRKKLEEFQKKSGNITTFLNDIHLNCGVDDCRAALELALKNYPDREFSQSVQNLLNRMPNYEKQMQSTVLSTSLSPQERFEQLWHLREKTLGQKEAKIGFGQEYDYAQYRFAYQDLLENGNLNTQQRLKSFEELQLKYIDSVSQEGNIAVYEQALNLLSRGQSESDVEEIKKMLQSRYLNEQEIQTTRQRDDRQQSQHKQAEQYQNAVKSLQNEMLPLKQQLNEADWNKLYEKRLEQLRLNLFSQN